MLHSLDNNLNGKRKKYSNYHVKIVKLIGILSSFIILQFYLITLCMFMMSSAHSDPTSAPGEVAEGLFGEGSKGYGEPDSVTGAMTWNYPFHLPSARGRPQPKLTLNYNSFTRVREAGYGWGLNLPVIERSPLSGNPCFHSNGTPISCGEQFLTSSGEILSEERYSYNGQPMVFICELPGTQRINDPDCGKEEQPKFATIGWRYFRLQIEGQFLRFYLSPDRKHWKVQLKGGELLEFGEPPNYPSPGIEHTLDNQNSIFRWRLVRHSDALHKIAETPINYIDYRWKKLGKRGLLYLTDIYYTPDINSKSKEVNFAHHTQLTWEPPDYPQTFYADIHRAKPDMRLSSVAVASMPWSGIGSREVIRTYYLSYAAKQGATTREDFNQVFTLWNHSFLTRIELEGRIGLVEDGNENIPLNNSCLCSDKDIAFAPTRGGDYQCCKNRLPPVTFEYEDGHPSFGIAYPTRILEGPDNVEEDKILPYLKSVGIIDFNQDGLPDLVQGWNSEFCNEAPFRMASVVTSEWLSENELDVITCGYNVDLTYKTQMSSRPIIGYLNVGIGPSDYKVNFSHQCMDAGTTVAVKGNDGLGLIGAIDFENRIGLTFYNADKKPSFITPVGGTTLIGLGSGGLLTWSLAQWSPFRARELLNASISIIEGEGKSDSGESISLEPLSESEIRNGCDAFNFNKDKFKPRWSWEKIQEIDWANSGNRGDFGYSDKSIPRWYVDIDGDGLIDRLADTGIPALEFNISRVEFTQRYGKNDLRLGGSSKPTQIPFAFNPNSHNPGNTNSLAPSSNARSDTKFYYVDINGDGLVDLVTQNPSDNAGIPRVRPGDGHGYFGCVGIHQPWTCEELPTEVAATYQISATGDLLPWPFTEDTFFNDVTGDGLADIVQYDKSSGEVRLWVNQDGQKFACSAIDSCVVGKVLDFRTSTYDIGEHRTTFADMNADGINDIVILTNYGAYVGLFMTKYAPKTDFNSASAPRPGLLIRIHNGYGATTHVTYRTIQSLDLLATNSSQNWQHHLPIAESVVTQILTTNSEDFSQRDEHYQFERAVQYYYENPAYDRWLRSFLGFRKVVTRPLGGYKESAQTATTYWFGPCQNNRTDIYDPVCPEGSDDEDYKSHTGRIVRVDYGNLGIFPPYYEGAIFRYNSKPANLWTKIIKYTRPIELFDRIDLEGRRVTYSYPYQFNTFLYDETLPVKLIDPLPPHVLHGDVLTEAPYQEGVQKHLRRMVEFDLLGNLKIITQNGIVKDTMNQLDSYEDKTRITLFTEKEPFDSVAPARLPCTRDWLCQPNYITLWEPQPVLSGSNPSKLIQKTRLKYTSAGDIASVEGWLGSDVVPLQRQHAEDRNIAPQPTEQLIKKGWHTLNSYAYDNWGNVIRSNSGQTKNGLSLNCLRITYDESYHHLISEVKQYVKGCGGFSLATQFTFHRGFEMVENSIEPNGGTSSFIYDLFGRPSLIFSPDPNSSPQNPTRILAGWISYNDKKPLSYIEAHRLIGKKYIRSVIAINALGETIGTFDQGDNENEWIANGLTVTNELGQISQIRKPFLFTDDPISTILNANLISIPTDTISLEIGYDEFGRRFSLSERQGNSHREILRYKFFPLAIETKDAEQLKSDGLHRKAFQRIEFDGFGNNIKSTQHTEYPQQDSIITSVKYDAIGAPTSIQRITKGGTYERLMIYDSLGRLMLNQEPNTGNNWRYAWDIAGRLVGTSDARGCGKNIFYDGLGRLRGEDYSPCLASHHEYTSPDLITGKGLETFYRYDEYETGQINPETSFIDDSSQNAVGNLVAVSDRGSNTRINYDVVGQIRRISRQIAKPESLTVGSSYASNWFTSRFDFDNSGQLVRRTSGVEMPELLINGTSEERYSYTLRGLPSGIFSSYGIIIDRIEYKPDGKPKLIAYGNSERTVAAFGYDGWQRLKQYKLLNTKGFPKSNPYVYFDYHFTEYDEIGNPLTIEDRSESFLNTNPLIKSPPEATPTQRRIMQYDDLYRLIQVNYSYQNYVAAAPWRSPFEPEINLQNRHPVPLQKLPTRILQQTFNYDGLGNLLASSDDLSANYDRSLGTNLRYGTSEIGPNQLLAGEGLKIRYDQSGNLTELKIERSGNCPTGYANQCAQWFIYDWDEVGQLERARRWDFDGNKLPLQESPQSLPTIKPSWDLTYAYSQGKRVRKSVKDFVNVTRHTLAIFNTLRIQEATFNTSENNYQLNHENVHAYLGGLSHVFWDSENQFAHLTPNSAITMFMNIGDHLGSNSIVINHANSELVERTTYQPYGAIESDYRPKGFREPYKFTGKEEDIEVGLTYFGARFYHPYLGRFISADPLSIHALGSDLNPYAYVGGRVITHVDPFGLEEVMIMPEDHIVGHVPPMNEDKANAPLNIRQPISFQRERPQPILSWVQTPTELEIEDDDVVTGQAASSAGGFQFRKIRTKRELLAAHDPQYAPRINAAERQDTFVRIAPLIFPLIIHGVNPASFAVEEGNLVAGSIRSVNKTIAGEVIGGQNCVSCSLATDATLGGNPASAIPGGPYFAGDVLKFHPESSFIPANGYGGIRTMMLRWGPGSRGIIWGTRGTETGHMFNVVNQGGIIRFLDAQTSTGAASLETFEGLHLLRTN